MIKLRINNKNVKTEKTVLVTIEERQPAVWANITPMLKKQDTDTIVQLTVQMNPGQHSSNRTQTIFLCPAHILPDKTHKCFFTIAAQTYLQAHVSLFILR